MKTLKRFLLISLTVFIATAFFACGKVAVNNNPSGDATEEYTVEFYAADGDTLFNTQTVKKGEEFTLPTHNNGRAITGYYTWEGSSWSAEYIPLADFDESGAKTVTCDLKFKAQYEWSGISR